MKVTFDSNVWEPIVKADVNEDSVYLFLLESIKKGLIEPYICMINLTLEVVPRKERIAHRAKYVPATEVVNIESDSDSITTSIALGPSDSSRPSMTEQLSDYLRRAHELGFKVLPMTNWGTPRLKEVPEAMKIIPEDYFGYADRVSECSEFIENLGCGQYQYNVLVDKLGFKLPVFEIEKFIAPKDKKVFAKAVAEWADAGALAAHYAWNNHYFCTNDQGKNAGRNSVFFERNLDLITTQFGLKVVTPETLISFLNIEKAHHDL